MEYLIVILLAAVILMTAVLLYLVMKKDKGCDSSQLLQQLEQLRRDTVEQSRLDRRETADSSQKAMESVGRVLSENQQTATSAQSRLLNEVTLQLNQKQAALQQAVTDQLAGMDRRVQALSQDNSQQLERIRATMEASLKDLREENAKKLDEVRAIVDEKLQKTLEERIGQSFQLVNERLEQVYRGLGEMQSLANGVGDLKKVLSNVKTRGILGEIQLGAILEEILSPEQYDTNVVTRPKSGNPVEFAVKMPGDGNATVYLPIDAKFPGDTYRALIDAYDSGSAERVAAAGTALERTLKGFAKDIRDKYVEVPYTTDFAIMFLPVEGLYAEAVRRGMVEVLQRDYKVNIAGPTTMAALLNSLQMGFRTLAIQKRSGEVWQVLGAVKSEFDKFGKVLAMTQQRLEQANVELDKLVGVRTRQILRRLKSVAVLPEEEAKTVLELTENDSETEE